MLDAGMDVVAVAESNTTTGAWRFLPDLMHQPGLMIQGLKYIYRLKRAGVQILQSHVLQGLQGNQEVEQAFLGKVDSRCRPISGETKRFDVDTVCIGYGLIPTTWVTSMLGCTHFYDPMIGGWVPQFNENMQTDQPGVFVAGDGAGIAGVLVAKMEGTLAGLYAAVHAGSISDRQGHASCPFGAEKAGGHGKISPGHRSHVPDLPGSLCEHYRRYHRLPLRRDLRRRDPKGHSARNDEFK